MLAFIHLVADAEALMLAKRGGLDLGKVLAGHCRVKWKHFVRETAGQFILNGSCDIALAEEIYETLKRGKAAYGGAA